MKKIGKFLGKVLVVICIIISYRYNVYASDLDEIKDYTVYVKPREDASLDLTYSIKWAVLDSTTEGPLTWIKVGIPNRKVKDITAISTNIKKIKYYKDNGDYVRIDLDRAYYAGETLDIKFSTNQSYMYTIENGTCKFFFTPGWFNDINVNKMSIYWQKDSVIASNAKKTNSDNCLVWSTALKKGTSISAQVSYNVNSFPSIKYNKQRTNYNEFGFQDVKTFFIAIGIVIMGIIIVVVLMESMLMGSYRYNRGYGYYGYYPYHSHCHYSSFDNDSFSSGSSCACACAGGGRAGCSLKDFYGTNLSSNNLKEVILSKKEENV